MRLLLVYAHRKTARRSGHRGSTLRHPLDKETLVWWPALGFECLRGHEFSHIIVDSDVVRHVGRADWQRLEAELRAHCLRIEPRIWSNPG